MTVLSGNYGIEVQPAWLGLFGIPAVETVEKEPVFLQINTSKIVKRREPLALESRRYIGNKAKLSEWILSVIKKEAPKATSFCDIFAGTASVANQAIGQYQKVYVNDLLYSNRVIYHAFFADGEWNREKVQALIDLYNAIPADKLPDNYFSLNYGGGRYYDNDTAKKIGFIRQDIEDRKEELTEKEYYVLLTTLIYNIDKIAHTVGHFEAYLKSEAPKQDLQLRLVDAARCPNVEIFGEDANALAGHIQADVVYMDPPYNSRQYSSAYHLLENLCLWQKPVLKGVARKPEKQNGKSRYCTQQATSAFEELIGTLKAKYIVLSYNNMAQKGNGRSNAKMDDKDIVRILEKKGKVKVFSRAHKAFSAGKSDIQDNQERLFICKVNEAAV